MRVDKNAQCHLIKNPSNLFGRIGAKLYLSSAIFLVVTIVIAFFWYKFATRHPAELDNLRGLPAIFFLVIFSAISLLIGFCGVVASLMDFGKKLMLSMLCYGLLCTSIYIALKNESHVLLGVAAFIALLYLLVSCFASKA
jgi:hypothetical protein